MPYPFDGADAWRLISFASNGRNLLIWCFSDFTNKHVAPVIDLNICAIVTYHCRIICVIMKPVSWSTVFIFVLNIWYTHSFPWILKPRIDNWICWVFRISTTYVGNVIWILLFIYHVWKTFFQFTKCSNISRLKVWCTTTRYDNGLNVSSPTMFLNRFWIVGSTSFPCN